MNKSDWIREAAKRKVLFFSVAATKRGGGGKRLGQKEKENFLKLEKKFRKKDDH